MRTAVKLVIREKILLQKLLSLKSVIANSYKVCVALESHLPATWQHPRVLTSDFLSHKPGGL
jgi:hypothetical protein